MNKKVGDYLRYLKRFGFNSVFVRNTLLFACVILVPTIIIVSVFSGNIRQSVNKEVTLTNQSRMYTARNAIDMVLSEAEMLAIQTAFDGNVSKFLMNLDKDSLSIYETQQTLKNYIKNYTNVFSYIHSIYIYSEKRDFIIDNDGNMPLKDHYDNSWHDIYEKLGNSETYIYARKWGGSYPNLISVIRTGGIRHGDKTGCVVINIDVSKLKNILYEYDDESYSELVMIDNNNKIVIADENKHIGTDFASYAVNKDKGSFESISETNILEVDNREFIYLNTPSSKYDFSYGILIPKTQVDVVMRNSMRLLIILIFVLFLVVILISVFIALQAYKPIHRVISVFTSDIDEGAINNNRSKNEISFVMDSIQKSIDTNTELSEELNYRLMLLNKAQTYALQAQINPHFLNNVLENINWTAVDLLGDENIISEMVHSLSALFDANYDAENYLVTIADELKYTNIYAYIISNSFASNFDLEWRVNPEISDCLIPKLVLQPILENACEHGVGRGAANGKVIISGDVTSEGIQFVVKDNGVGIEKDKLDKLSSELNSEKIFEKKHLGIKNVNQRIKLIFGKQYGVTIESEVGKGTSVKIFIPKIDDGSTPDIYNV